MAHRLKSPTKGRFMEFPLKCPIWYKVIIEQYLLLYLLYISAILCYDFILDLIILYNPMRAHGVTEMVRSEIEIPYLSSPFFTLENNNYWLVIFCPSPTR